MEMIDRRQFLQNGIKAVAGAQLIGTTLASGMSLPGSVPALKGKARQVVVPTHEHFGDIEERLDFPAAWEIILQPMAGHNAPVLGRDEILNRIRMPIGTRQLRDLAAGKKSAVITFDDLTRPTPTYAVAPLVVEELLAAGVPEERIIFMGSYGTHRNLEQDEAVRKLGQPLLQRFAWVNHNTWDNLKDIGTTKHGNVVTINRTFAAADIRVTISGVKAHAFAGYGGGSKAILPGVTGFDTVDYNHSIVMKSLVRPPADVISMFKNEVRRDMDEAARLANVDFSIQVLYNGKRQITHVFAGNIIEAHLAACRAAVRHYQTPTVASPDIVICNTYPQSTQGGRYKWATTVRAGGTCVLILQHPQGLSAMHYWDQRREHLNGKTDLDVLAMPRPPLTGNVQVIVFSQYMDRRQMLKFPAKTSFAATWAEVIQQLQARHQGNTRVAVYPYAAIQHPETKLDEPSA
jgi:nickel-dependent lactate racemase